MILRKIKRYVPCRARPNYDPAHHCHVIECSDIATGVSLPHGGIPLTAFRYRCKICKREITDVCEYGIEQLQAGHTMQDVFQWTKEQPHG